MTEQVFTSARSAEPHLCTSKTAKLPRSVPSFLTKATHRHGASRPGGRSSPRPANPNPYSVTQKARIYSENRIKYPMKRVDFDPKGKRNQRIAASRVMCAFLG